VTTFQTEVETLYGAHGEHHILPFVGRAYETPTSTEFRVAAIGFNSYVSPEHWPERASDASRWVREWWRHAGQPTGSHHFYHDAFREVVALSSFVNSAPAWSHLEVELSPTAKGSLYATNTLKVHTDEEYKQSTSIPEALIKSFAPT
jgi:hypothetical protein